MIVGRYVCHNNTLVRHCSVGHVCRRSTDGQRALAETESLRSRLVTMEDGKRKEANYRMHEINKILIMVKWIFGGIKSRADFTKN